jgi:hypothetical protein
MTVTSTVLIKLHSHFVGKSCHIAEYEDLMYIILVIQLDVVFRPENNILISIITPSILISSVIIAFKACNDIPLQF